MKFRLTNILTTLLTTVILSGCGLLRTATTPIKMLTKCVGVRIFTSVDIEADTRCYNYTFFNKCKEDIQGVALVTFDNENVNITEGLSTISNVIEINGLKSFSGQICVDNSKAKARFDFQNY